MLKAEIEKKKNSIMKRRKKKLESIKLTHQTSDLDHEIKITS